jgi:hypothetical protein
LRFANLWSGGKGVWTAVGRDSLVANCHVEQQLLLPGEPTFIALNLPHKFVRSPVWWTAGQH